MSISNPLDHGIVLLRAESAAAESVMLAQVSGTDMTAVDTLVIPAGESAALAADGTALVLDGLVKPLEANTAISLTLHFDSQNDDGSLADEHFLVTTAAAVLDAAPADSPFVFILPWARPTVAPAMDDMGAMATPDMMMATPDMMAMGTPDAGMGGMGGMAMDGGVSGVFMTILNTGDSADKLVAAASDAAKVVEIHQTSMVNDVMQMRPVEGGLDLPAGEMVLLQPGGYHVMLIDLNYPLVPGEAIVLTLTFESGAEVTLAVPIYDPMMMGMDDHHDH
jgi:copper(I)-binding protein